MKLAILSLPKIERDKLMQTLLADKAKGDLGLIRACGLDPEVFDRQFLTVCISRDLRSTSVSLHNNEMEMLWSMNQLDALIESGSREPFHVRKAGTFDGDMDAARETAAKVMDDARREAGYRGETREDLKKWLIETGRLPANCDDLKEPLIERQETPGRKENADAILMPDANELRTVLSEVSEALKDDDAVGIVVCIGPIDYFIPKNDSGLPGKVLVAVQEGSQVLGALYLKRNFDGMSGRLQRFQKHENDESAKKRLQGVLDKMLTDCAQTENERRPVRLGKFEKELRDQATRIENDKKAKEAALDQPHHLLFFSAVDPDRVTRFFDILNQGDGFSLAETAVGAPRLGGCTETVYKSPSGGTHHVHRLYGKFPTDSAHRAMQDFAKHTGLTQVAEIAETLNLREAQPTWELIFEKLGCSTAATGLASQEEETKLKDERPDYSAAAPSAENHALRAITGDTKQEPTDEVPWDVIAGIIESSGAEVTRGTNHISFDGELGRTSVTVRPIALKSPQGGRYLFQASDGSVHSVDDTPENREAVSRIDPDHQPIPGQKKLIAVITVETKLPRLLLPEHRGTAAINMASALSALVQDNDGNWKLVSRLSFYEGDHERREVYVGLVAFGALLHASALCHSLKEISKVPDQRPPLNLPHESEPSRWSGEEFNHAQKVFQERGVFATASDKGLTAEFPWDEGSSVALIKPGNDINLTEYGAYLAVTVHYRQAATKLGQALDEAQAAYWHGAEIATREQMRTSLLQLTTREAHPRIGNGLFCRLELPLKMSDEDANETASRLNLLDFAAADSPPFFGSWCSSPQSGRVTYVSFWPNLLFHPGTAAMVASWMEHRSAQAHQWITGANTSAEQQVKWSLSSGSKLSSSSGVTKESRGSQKLALTSQEERITGDVGPEFLAFIYEQMKIDPEWSVRGERNLTWWGHRLAQRIWAETVIMEDGDEIARVHAETDVLRNVDTAAHATQSLSILNRNASLSAYVWNPETKKISLRSSAYFHSQNFPWLSVFFLSVVSLQAAEAHLQPDALAKLVGGEVDESAHPTNGFREQKDEMLDVIPLLYAPWGKNPSQFTREDFHAAMELDPKPWLMANEGEKGLTAEFRFPGCMPPTALLTVDNEIRHPLFGSGLFILLRLPLTLRGANVDSLASQLNLAELRNPTRTHFMGSWCVDSPRNVKLAQLGLLLMGESLPVGILEKGAKETLSFCSFIPSVCHRPGLLENIVYSMGCRTMWANEYLASEEGVPAEFGPRHSEAFQEQSRQHLSLGKRLLDRALRHIKKKPN